MLNHIQTHPNTKRNTSNALHQKQAQHGIASTARKPVTTAACARGPRGAPVACRCRRCASRRTSPCRPAPTASWPGKRPRARTAPKEASTADVTMSVQATEARGHTESPPTHLAVGEPHDGERRVHAERLLAHHAVRAALPDARARERVSINKEEGFTRSHRSMQASISTVMPLSSGSLNAPAELAIRIELAAGEHVMARSVRRVLWHGSRDESGAHAASGAGCG